MSLNTYSTDLELSSSQYWSVVNGSQTGLNFTTDFTIEGWVKLEQLPSTAANEMTILARLSAGSGGYLARIMTTDKLRCYFESAAGSPTVFDSTAAFFVADDVGNWVHFAMVADISVPSVTMYKNGSSVGTSSVLTSATTLGGPAATMYIGVNYAGTDEYYDGMLDEIRVWDDIRTSGEISANYNTQLVGNETNLQAYYQFNNDALDITSNNNDLTGTNSPVFSTSVPFVGSLFVPKVVII